MEDQSKKERRAFVRKIVGASLGSGLLIKWIKPICDSVVLPAHALTSVVVAPESPPEDPPEDPHVVLNTPPQGEDVVIDAQYSLPISYSMLPHISDFESLPTELTLAIASLPKEGTIELLDQAEIVYQLKPEYINAHGGSDRFNYQVFDPQGALSAVYQIEIINLPYVEA